MSFRDFNDEGPGTFEWDYVIGGNSTGLFPEETHYEVDGDTLIEVVYKHTGGNQFDPFYGSCWSITEISEVRKEAGKDWFTFKQDGSLFKATVNKRLSSKGQVIVDLEQIG